MVHESCHGDIRRDKDKPPSAGLKSQELDYYPYRQDLGAITCSGN